MVSRQALQWSEAQGDPERAAPAFFEKHPWWTKGANWAEVLANLRVVMQPMVCFCWLLPWVEILGLPQLIDAFQPLLAAMNTFHALIPT